MACHPRSRGCRQPVEGRGKGLIRARERIPISGLPRQQIGSLAGFGILQPREECINRFAKLLGLGRGIDASGKTTPRGRPQDNADHRDGQPENG